MKCEHTQGCGFYNLMMELGRAGGDSCGKKDPQKCPRVLEVQRGYLTPQELYIFRLKPGEKLHPYDAAVTHEELYLAHSNKG